jgi:7-cyano-7-deazaguanine reductase
MSTMTLGQATEYPQEYAPDVLCSVARRESRQSLGIAGALPFHGVDVWNA